MRTKTKKTAWTPGALAGVSYEVCVPPRWFALVMSARLFESSFCGYWAFGIDAGDGTWLVFEHGDERPDDRACMRALKAHKAGRKMPRRWHVLDRKVATAAFLLGCRYWGETWYADANACRIDSVIQCAIFGKERYS